MTMKNGVGKCALFVLSANSGIKISKYQNMVDSSSFLQRKPNMEKSLFDWPIVLQYYFKAKYRLIY